MSYQRSIVFSTNNSSYAVLPSTGEVVRYGQSPIRGINPDAVESGMQVNTLKYVSMLTPCVEGRAMQFKLADGRTLTTTAVTRILHK